MVTKKLGGGGGGMSTGPLDTILPRGPFFSVRPWLLYYMINQVKFFGLIKLIHRFIRVVVLHHWMRNLQPGEAWPSLNIEIVGWNKTLFYLYCINCQQNDRCISLVPRRARNHCWNSDFPYFLPRVRVL